MTESKLDQRYPDNWWDGRGDYMRLSRVLLHNDDYLEFLVTKVWTIDAPCRVVDFGCGSGRFGQMIMPLLPEGSTYAGFDQSAVLLEEAKKVFAGSPYSAEFRVAGVNEAPFADDSFDLAISQAVLMHIPDPMGAIREMMRVTRHGGMVITCDANRNAANAIIHTDELDMQENVPLHLIQTVNREVRRRTGVDHNIGIKTPILMHKAGLKDVQARVSDCVRLVLPPVESDYQEAVFRAICNDGYAPPSDEEGRARLKAHLVKYGISEEDAQREVERELASDFGSRGRDYHTAYASLLSFSFGRVDKLEF